MDQDGEGFEEGEVVVRCFARTGDRCYAAPGVLALAETEAATGGVPVALAE